MPNDMSNLGAFHAPSSLANRTARYCARAQDLAQDPRLTARIAESAMTHLEALQKDLAKARLCKTHPIRAELRIAEDDFRPLEAQLKQARADLSNALLRSGDGYGLRPHGRDLDAVIDDEYPAASAEDPADILDNGSVRAVSACRALLDLEALRPYLSDQALRTAIEKHSRETRRYNVSGVAYATLPASAHLPCEVI